MNKLIKKQHGASLLEVLAYLGVASVILVGAVSLLNSANSASDSQKTMVEITGLATGVKSLFAGQSNYGTVSLNATLIAAKSVPSTLSVSGATITNSYNGAVVVTGANSAFTILSPSVPVAVCAKILSQMGSQFSAASVVGTATTVLTLPVTPTAAAAACAATTGKTDITFTS